MPEFNDRRPCGRCKGSGYMPQFAHVANGKCVACQGSGTRSTKVVGPQATPEQQAADTAAWEAEQAAKRDRIAARAARRAARQAGSSG